MNTMTEVRERPILMSGAMVRATLDGTKTQTRRVVSDYNTLGNWRPSECDMTTAWVDPGPSPAGNPGPYLKAHVTARPGEEIVDRIYSRTWAGDRLWVKETFCPVNDEQFGGEQWIDYRATPKYSAGHPAGWENAPEDAEALKWKPSIFMPRALSRISLDVIGVRPERVQQITADDAVAEGLAKLSKDGGRTWKYGVADTDGTPGSDLITRWSAWDQNPVVAYASLWNNLNASRGFGWDVNPWVWVIDFKRFNDTAVSTIGTTEK